MLQEYTCLTQRPDCPAQVWVFLACVFFFLGLYREAEEAASKGTSSRSLVQNPAKGVSGFDVESFAAAWEAAVTVEMKRKRRLWQLRLIEFGLLCFSSTVPPAEPAALPPGPQGPKHLPFELWKLCVCAVTW